MLGSYGPSKGGTPYRKVFPTEESPTGMLARTGTYAVRSRVIDDDDVVYAGPYFSIFLMALYPHLRAHILAGISNSLKSGDASTDAPGL